MTLKNQKQFHHTNLPLQILSLGTRDFFWSPAHEKIVENLAFFDTAKKTFSSYAPRLITIYFVIIFFQS